jgi:hypothetical protein
MRNGSYQQSVKILEQDLKHIQSELNLTVNKGLEQVGKKILETSNRYVPVDTGRLCDSGHYYVSEAGKNSSAVVDYTAPYAVYVHEDLTMRHPNGGQAKFLERAVKEVLPQMPKILEEVIGKALKWQRTVRGNKKR